MSFTRRRGLTTAEALTALVALVVLGAAGIALWRSHELRTRRDDGMAALLEVQAAQDRYFGTHARYASAAQLPADDVSSGGHYRISIRDSADGLGYWAIASVIAHEGEVADSRCVELRLDQNGRRFAVNAKGEDRSADCWRR